MPHETGTSRSTSYWMETSGHTSFPPLAQDVEVDVAIVGGGIVGITAAFLLARAGRRVVVLERDRLAMGETGHTTAHLQSVIDTPLATLVPRFGLDAVRRAWDSQLEAMRFIEETSRAHGIACDFRHVDALLYSPSDEDRGRLKEERRLAREMGYPCEWAAAADVPFGARHAISFPNQAKFHPRKYLLGLLAEAQRAGAVFHEGTDVVGVEGGETVRIETREGPVVRASWWICATNVPFVGSEALHTRMMPYRSYAVAARVPKGVFPDALLWDTLDPYHYTRVEHRSDHDLVILGGEDHRVGENADAAKAWRLLWEHLGEATVEFEPVHEWSGEVIETQDDFPYIGRIPGRGENELMVTGDSGTGMTNGTIGAIMCAERILGRGTPWDELYDPARGIEGAGVAKEWATHNLRAGATLLKRALQPSEVDDITSLAPGEGALVKHHLKPVAVSRLPDGTLCAVSGICTHMGCPVKWNDAETSWDCGCHGSRFAATGEVLHGPATRPLAPVDLSALLERGEKARR